MILHQNLEEYNYFGKLSKGLPMSLLFLPNSMKVYSYLNQITF